MVHLHQPLPVINLKEVINHILLTLQSASFLLMVGPALTIAHIPNKICHSLEELFLAAPISNELVVQNQKEMVV
jgi:hypothetical protein